MHNAKTAAPPASRRLRRKDEGRNGFFPLEPELSLLVIEKLDGSELEDDLLSKPVNE